MNTVHEVQVIYEDHKIWPNGPFQLEIYLVNVKFMWKIKSNFVACLENLTYTIIFFCKPKYSWECFFKNQFTQLWGRAAAGYAHVFTLFSQENSEMSSAPPRNNGRTPTWVAPMIVQF